MRKAGALTSLRYRARRLRSRLGLAGLWAADRLEWLCDRLAVGLLQAEALHWPVDPVSTTEKAVARRYGQVQHDYAQLNGGVGILRPVVPPRRSPTGIARRNDLLAIRAIAERRPRASAWAVDVVLLELREHGASVSIAEAEQIARRILCASTYQPLVQFRERGVGDVLDGMD